MFQCSSASRKFLNPTGRPGDSDRPTVSVLFSEPKIPQSHQRAIPRHIIARVSVLFSEPKIPQSNGGDVDDLNPPGVSVLFSEPKIPQFSVRVGTSSPNTKSFSALQRAENSSIAPRSRAAKNDIGFSALQRAENSSIAGVPTVAVAAAAVSVLFSEPKIPQSSTSRARG